MIEFQVIPAMVVAFAVASAFMFALRPVAKAIGLVDQPGGRKSHDGDIPVVGGTAMFAGVLAGMTLVNGTTYSIPTLLVACFLLLLVGLLDDRYHIPVQVRLATQIAAVVIMVYGADLSLYGIGDPFGSGEVLMGRFTLIFTMLVTLTMINAYNLIDGVDGLAGSLALVALLAISAVAGVGHMATAVALTVSAAIVGFLLFNFPVAWNRHVRCFMGDAGSTFLGFTIVWVTLGISQGPERLISPVICLWFASIPIYDCLTCFVRRALSGKSPFASGSDHFHHTLKRGGFGVRATLGILAGLQAIYAIVALLGHFAQVPDVVMFTGWSALGLSQHSIIGKISQLHRHRALAKHRTT